MPLQLEALLGRLLTRFHLSRSPKAKNWSKILDSASWSSSPIGRGATSEVWEVSIPESTVKYAVKVISKVSLGRWRSEVDVMIGMQDFRGSVLPELYGWFETSESVYLVLPLYSASVYEQLQGLGLPSAAEVRGLLASLGHALSLLHTRGLVHRDLKAQNIVSTADAAVLIDYGLAERGVPGPPPLCGTAPYWSPEHLNRQSVDDPCTVDVWAFAVLAYYLSTGHFPFRNLSSSLSSDEAADMAEAMMDGPATYHGVPRLLRQLLKSVFVPAHERPTIREVLSAPYFS